MNLIKRVFLFLAVGYLFTSFKNKDLTWVAIGDSITYLNDHLDETKYRVTKGYLTDVTEAIPDLQYINKGYNGWTSGNIAAHIDRLGLSKADVYSVFLGTNDWWQGRSIGTMDDYKSNKGNISLYGSFRIIIDKIRSLNPEAKIILITPLQRADFVYINDPKNNAFGSYKPKKGQYLETFALAIDSIGKYEHISVVDLYHNKALGVANMVKFKRLRDPKTGHYKDYKFPASTKIPFDPSKDEYPYPKQAIDVAFDGLHPSDKGNVIIAHEIVRSLKRLMHG